MMKKSSSTASLPRISSTLSICSLPRTNSSSSLGRKGSFEDLLNYASFFDDSCLNADSSLNTPSTVLVPNSSLIVDGCADLVNDELPSTSTLTKAALKEHNEQQEKLDEAESFDFELLQRKIKNMPNVKQTTSRTCHSKPEITVESPEDEAETAEQEDFVDEDAKTTEITQISISGGEDGGPKKISFGAYGEFTIIDGIMYNNRGYEICGHLNQHNRPCQRIGKCPFHSKNKKQNIEKLLKLTEQHSTSSSAPQLTSAPTLQSIVTPSSSSSQSTTEKKKHQPMKKTPYKQGWSKEEHFRFLTGLEIHGKGAWKDIAMIVGTRTPTQIQSHAQKYYLRQKQKIKNKRSIHDFTLEDLKKALAQNGASISINTAASSSIPEDESESSDEFIESETKRSKKSPETKSSVTVSPNSQLRAQAPVSTLPPASAGLTASIQQALDWTKNVAAYLSALQAVQGQQQKPGMSASNNMMSYSMLGNMLMGNPLLMQQQQLQSMVQQAQLPKPLETDDFLSSQTDMTGLPRNPSLQSLNFEPLYSFEQTAFDPQQASTADLMNVFEQPQDLTSSHSLFSPIKTEKMKRRLSETSLPAEQLEEDCDFAPPSKLRRH